MIYPINLFKLMYFITAFVYWHFRVKMDNSEVIQARRTESLDAPEIIKLITPPTEKLFGRVNIVNIMYVNIYCLWTTIYTYIYCFTILLKVLIDLLYLKAYKLRTLILYPYIPLGKTPGFSCYTLHRSMNFSYIVLVVAHIFVQVSFICDYRHKIEVLVALICSSYWAYTHGIPLEQ